MSDGKIVTTKRAALRTLWGSYKVNLFTAMTIPVALYSLYLVSCVVPSIVYYALIGNIGGLLFSVAFALFLLLTGTKFLSSAGLQILIRMTDKKSNVVATKKLCHRALTLNRVFPKFMNHDQVFYEVMLGRACLALGDYAEAEHIFATGIARDEPFVDQAPSNFAIARYYNLSMTYCHLAVAQVCQNELSEGESSALRALEICDKPNSKSYDLLKMYPIVILGNIHILRGDLEQASEKYNRALLIFKESPAISWIGSSSTDPPLMAASLGLAIVTVRQDDSSSSFTHWRDYEERASHFTDPISPNVLKYLNMYANDCMNLKHNEVAEQVLNHAYMIAQRNFDHPSAKETLNYFEKLLLLTGRESEVKDMRAWLRSTHLVNSGLELPSD